MEKRGLYISVFILLGIIFIQSVIAYHLSGNQQIEQIKRWNQELGRYANILQTRALTDTELAQAISIASTRKSEMIELLKKMLISFLS